MRAARLRFRSGVIFRHMNAATHRPSDFFTAVRAVVLAGCTALAGSSCTSYYPQPGPGGNVFIQDQNRPRYGYNGSQSPNNAQQPRRQAEPARRSDDSSPPANRPPSIKRDPNDTTVDMTPPERKSERTPEPDAPAPEATEKSAPPVEKYTPPVEKTTPPPVETKPAGREDLPYGTPIVGKKGFVYSPYYTTGEVDVQGIASGTKVRCPYTKKIFRVP